MGRISAFYFLRNMPYGAAIFAAFGVLIALTLGEAALPAIIRWVGAAWARLLFWLPSL